jgi:hypothetical protein
MSFQKHLMVQLAINQSSVGAPTSMTKLAYHKPEKAVTSAALATLRQAFHGLLQTCRSNRNKAILRSAGED